MDKPIPYNKSDHITLYKKTRTFWGDLVRDIIFAESDTTGIAATPEDLCDAYNITTAELNALFQHPEFKLLLDQTRLALQNGTGIDPSTLLQTQTLARELTQRVFERALDKNPHTKMGDKELLLAWKLMMQFGHLDPATNGTNKASDNGNTNNVQLKLVIPNGIEGLDHLREPLIEGEYVES